jgi:hypothetical protein
MSKYKKGANAPFFYLTTQTLNIRLTMQMIMIIICYQLMILKVYYEKAANH